MKAAFICAVLAFSAHAGEVAPPTVQVSALARVDEHSYRKLQRGLEAFEKYRHLAPNAPLRFRAEAYDPADTLDGLVLQLKGETFTQPIPLDERKTFVIEANAQALAEDADLMSNRRRGSIGWDAFILSPGLPPNTMRLGDARLACQVALASAMEVGSAVGRMLPMDRCTSPLTVMWNSASRTLFGVEMEYGARKMSLRSRELYMRGSPIAQLGPTADRYYALPLSDASWPDDTLVRLDFLDDPQRDDAAVFGEHEAVAALRARAALMLRPGVTTLAEAQAAFAGASVSRFDSGAQLLLVKEAMSRWPRGQHCELAMMFDRAGILRRFAVRPPAG